MQPRFHIVSAWFAVVALIGCTHPIKIVSDAASEVPADAPVDPGPGALDCVPPYQTVETTPGKTVCFRTVAIQRTWLDAELDCENDGPTSHLVVISDPDEHELVHNLSTKTWVGATDRVSEGTFAWVTAGDGVVVPLDVFQTMNSDAADCAQQQTVAGAKDWFHLTCTTALSAYICERDAYAADPALYTPPP